MRILVCVKRVPAPGARINLTEDAMAIDAKNLGFAISPHEECAVEEAVQIAERTGGHVTVLTMGSPDAEEQLRAAIAVGAHAAHLLTTDGSDVDPTATAAALLDAIRTLEQDGTFDLILLGNESADAGGYQVGIRVAHELGRPIVNGVKAIELGDGTVTAHRPTDSATEVYELPLPAVLGVKEGINLPRYPTFKGRLNAKKAEVRSQPATVSPGGQRLVQLLQPPQQVTETTVLGSGPEAADALVDVLAELGVV